MRWLSICGNDFIAHWVYVEQIFAYDKPAFKCLTVFTRTSKCMLSQHVNEFTTCWAYVETISSLAEHKRKWFHHLLSKKRNFSEKRVVNCMMVDPSRLQRGRLVFGGRVSSTEEETHLRRGRLVYGGGDSSTEGKIHLWRGKLIFGGRDSSTERETHLWRRLVSGGGDLSTEGKIHLRRGILFYGTKLIKVVRLIYIFSPVKRCLFVYPVIKNC